MADSYTAPTEWNTGTTVDESKLEQQIRDNLTAIVNTLVGDASASTLRQRGASGTFAARPTAGNAGRTYYATDCGILFLDNGVRWDSVGYNDRLCEHFFDDFVAANDQLTTFGAFPKAVPGWDGNYVLTGSASVVGSTNRTKISLATGATNASNTEVRPSSRSGYAVGALRVPALLATLIDTPATTQGTYRIGLADGVMSSDPTNGIFFRRADVASAANWFAVTRAAGVETATNTTITGNTLELLLEIEVVSASSVKFYLGGNLVATHSANIPTANLHIGRLNVTNTEAVNKELRCDYVSWAARRL